MPPQSRPRNIVFTLNNYVEADRQRLRDLDAAYLLAAAEVGESGTPHLQGYAELKAPTSFSTLASTLAKRAHIEVCRDKLKAEEYVRKGEQPHAEWSEKGVGGPNYGTNLEIWLEYGQKKQQGKRSDLDAVTEMLQSGKRLRDIAEELPIQFIKYSKGIQSWLQVSDTPRSKDEPLDVVVHYGPTGTGKTWKAMEDFPELFKYSVTCGQWFDGYDGQEQVLIDEYRGQLPFAMLLQLLDVYPLQVQVKGGFKQWKPNKIIITSPVHPALWYKNLDKDHDGLILQLQRRINAIYLFKNKYQRGQPVVVEDHTDKDWDAVKGAAALAAAASASGSPAFAQF